MISPAGGAVALTDGGGTIYMLTVPAGALASDTAITITTLEPAAGQLFRLMLAPAGLLFAGGNVATLTITLPAGVSFPATGGFLYNGSPVPFTLNPDGTLTVMLAAFLDSAVASASVQQTAGQILLALGDFVIGTAQAAIANCGSASASDSPGLTALADVDLELYIQCMEAAITQLDQSGDFRSALEANLSIAALIQRSGSNSDANAAIARAEQNACAIYSDVLDIADQVQVGNFGQLRSAIEKVMYWEATTQRLGASCSGLPSYTDLIDRKMTEAIAFYDTQTDELADTRNAEYNAGIAEVTGLREFQDEAAALDVPAVAAPVADQAEAQIVDQLLTGPWNDCRNSGDYAGLVRLVNELNSAAARSAAQYCGTRLSFEVLNSQNQVQSSSTSPLGGTAAGAQTVTGTATALADGQLRLTGPIHAMDCPNGSPDSEDLVFILNGVEVARLDNAPFLAAPLTLDLATILQQAGITAGNSQHPLTLTRDSGACNGFWGANPQPLLTLNLNFGSLMVVSNGGIEFRPGDSGKFRAKDSGGAEVPVTWSATGGSISDDGLFTASITPGNFVVTAARVSNSQQRATANVRIYKRWLLHDTQHTGRHTGGTIRHLAGDGSGSTTTSEVPPGVVSSNYSYNERLSLDFVDDSGHLFVSYHAPNPRTSPIDSGGSSVSSSAGECRAHQIGRRNPRDGDFTWTSPGSFTASVDDFGNIAGTVTCDGATESGFFNGTISFTQSPIRPNPDPVDD